MEILTPPNEEKWRDFVQRCPNGNIFKSPEMLHIYQRAKNYEPISLAVLEEDEVKGIVLGAVIREGGGMIGSFSSSSIIQGGPLCSRPDYLSVLMRRYDEVASRKALYSQIRNLFGSEGYKGELQKIGYVYKDHLNFLIDLTMTEEDLWRKLDKGRRKGISKAEKMGLEVGEVERREELRTFYELVEETYKNVKLPLADISLFEAAWDILHHKGGVKFFLAKHDGESIAARCVLVFRGTIHDWYAGSKAICRDKHPDEYLVWQILRWGQRNDCKVFDFGGAGHPNEDYGPREFKRRFGGKLVNYGRFEKVYYPKKLWLSKKAFALYRRIG